jgi:hypothetical protein
VAVGIGAIGAAFDVAHATMETIDVSRPRPSGRREITLVLEGIGSRLSVAVTSQPKPNYG